MRILTLSHEAKIPLTSFRNYPACYDSDSYNAVFKGYLDEVEELQNQNKNIKELKASLKQLKFTFVQRMEIAKRNAKFAPTVLHLLKTHSEFKSTGQIRPWVDWRSGSDLLRYCREKSLRLDSIYSKIPTMGQKIKKPKKYFSSF